MNPEPYEKRIAQMQQDPPFEGKLTVIWETEKREILERLEALEAKVHALETHAQTSRA